MFELNTICQNICNRVSWLHFWLNRGQGCWAKFLERLHHGWKTKPGWRWQLQLDKVQPPSFFSSKDFIRLRQKRSPRWTDCLKCFIIIYNLTHSSCTHVLIHTEASPQHTCAGTHTCTTPTLAFHTHTHTHTLMHPQINSGPPSISNTDILSTNSLFPFIQTNPFSLTHQSPSSFNFVNKQTIKACCKVLFIVSWLKLTQ